MVSGSDFAGSVLGICGVAVKNYGLDSLFFFFNAAGYKIHAWFGVSGLENLQVPGG